MQKKSGIIYQAQHQSIQLMEVEVSIHLAEHYLKRAKRLLRRQLSRKYHKPHQHAHSGKSQIIGRSH